MQCFNIENQAFYSIFGSNRNILRLKYRVILPCSAQLSNRTLLNFPEVLTSTLISTQVKAQDSFQWFLILQCKSDIPHISIMFQALDLEGTFTLPLIHRYTLATPPPPSPPKKRTRYVRFGEGEGGGGGKMYLKHCDKSGKLQIKVLSVMWPGKREFACDVTKRCLH